MAHGQCDNVPMSHDLNLQCPNVVVLSVSIPNVSMCQRPNPKCHSVSDVCVSLSIGRRRMSKPHSSMSVVLWHCSWRAVEAMRRSSHPDSCLVVSLLFLIVVNIFVRHSRSSVSLFVVVIVSLCCLMLAHLALASHHQGNRSARHL